MVKDVFDFPINRQLTELCRLYGSQIFVNLRSGWDDNSLT